MTFLFQFLFLGRLLQVPYSQNSCLTTLLGYLKAPQNLHLMGTVHLLHSMLLLQCDLRLRKWNLNSLSQKPGRHPWLIRLTSHDQVTNTTGWVLNVTSFGQAIPNRPSPFSSLRQPCFFLSGYTALPTAQFTIMAVFFVSFLSLSLREGKNLTCLVQY